MTTFNIGADTASFRPGLRGGRVSDDSNRIARSGAALESYANGTETFGDLLPISEGSVVAPTADISDRSASPGSGNGLVRESSSGLAEALLTLAPEAEGHDASRSHGIAESFEQTTGGEPLDHLELMAAGSDSLVEELLDVQHYATTADSMAVGVPLQLRTWSPAGQWPPNRDGDHMGNAEPAGTGVPVVPPGGQPTTPSAAPSIKQETNHSQVQSSASGAAGQAHQWVPSLGQQSVSGTALSRTTASRSGTQTPSETNPTSLDTDTIQTGPQAGSAAIVQADKALLPASYRKNDFEADIQVPRSIASARAVGEQSRDSDSQSQLPDGNLLIEKGSIPITSVRSEVTALPGVNNELSIQIAKPVVAEASNLITANKTIGTPPEAPSVKFQQVKVLEIGLNPRELGNVSVRMTLVGNTITLDIKAAEPEAAEKIQRDSTNLRKLLVEAGLSPDNIVVQVADVDRTASSKANPLNFQSADSNPQMNRDGGAFSDPRRSHDHTAAELSRRSGATGNPASEVGNNSEHRRLTPPRASAIYL